MTIPKEVRRRLHLQAGDEVEFVVLEEGRAVMIPRTSSITKLKGILPKPSRMLSLEEMDEAIAHAASGDIDWD